MREGDARPIRPDLVHDLFWLGKPSVTLVVRREKGRCRIVERTGAAMRVEFQED